MTYTQAEISYIIAEDVFIEKNLVDQAFGLSVDPIKIELYLDMIRALDSFEETIRKDIKKKLININNIFTTKENNLFELRRHIYNDIYVFYLPEYENLVITNRYVVGSDVREYKSTRMTSGLDFSTYRKILTHITYNKIEKSNKIKSPFLTAFLNIDIIIKNLDNYNIDHYNIDNYNLINNFWDLEELLIWVKISKTNQSLKGELKLDNLRKLSIIGPHKIPNLKNLPSLSSLELKRDGLPKGINLLTSNLKQINLSNCSIYNFNIPLPLTLEELDLSDNYLTSIKICCPNVKNLNISRNILHTVQLIGFQKLSILDGSSNRLVNITLGGEIDQIPVSYMKHIKLNNNYINEVNFLGKLYESLVIPTEQVINLSKNRLTSIEGMFDYMPYLTDLDVSYNTIKEIPSIMFPNNLLIQDFNISHNKIDVELPNECISHLSKSFHHE